MSNRNRGQVLLAGTLLVCACAGETRTDFENEGEVCVSTDGDTLQVVVFFPTCLSSSCDQELDTSCEMTLEGDTITLSSRGAFVSNDEGACTADCGALSARCSLSAVEDGQYELVHGDRSTTIMMPDASGSALAPEDRDGVNRCGL